MSRYRIADAVAVIPIAAALSLAVSIVFNTAYLRAIDTRLQYFMSINDYFANSMNWLPSTFFVAIMLIFMSELTRKVHAIANKRFSISILKYMHLFLWFGFTIPFLLTIPLIFALWVDFYAAFMLFLIWSALFYFRRTGTVIALRLAYFGSVLIPFAALYIIFDVYGYVAGVRALQREQLYVFSVLPNERVNIIAVNANSMILYRYSIGEILVVNQDNLILRFKVLRPTTENILCHAFEIRCIMKSSDTNE